ncbi:hypothetical protein SAMD00019534_011210 [Acytostelium subglobosum LB1]|uniref:hypothetical protein n=1 Tax=Acytostelium subglobosum LB1 TaxID=1410327 RepID=UPI000644EF9C|nr:hypothetical protein SAMD00019534_011210 [Acytostelium subglobosum LB1]GAM17946.1 hypothetical protein SAMD00019534_011210 [Acytostelium subglobosum LB1]|eukprot:XP_012758542.1 hypothetical protein SAMD00019534_011210 [Acytostelium subglobosum LB1]
MESSRSSSRLIWILLLATLVLASYGGVGNAESDLFGDTFLNYELPCKKIPPSPTVPDHVTKVRPSDIKVAMGIGDSSSAGFVMMYEKFGDSINEFRGRSFPNGGDPGAATIPNFLKSVGANVVGGGRGSNVPLMFHYVPKNMRANAFDFNKAQLAAAASQGILVDVPDLVEYLHFHLNKTDPPVDNEKDWKLFTYFIGSNDVCHVCDNKETSFSNWIDGYYSTLALIKEKFPRTIVNVMLINNIVRTEEISVGKKCNNLRRFLEFCTCLNNEQGRAAMAERRANITRVIKESVTKINKLNSPEFRVVLQPFMEDYKIDLDHLSPFDCFHPNQKGSKIWSLALWNNMMSPPKLKKHYIEPNIKPICPTENTYLVYDE